jgi:hypothetical protein
LLNGSGATLAKRSKRVAKPKSSPEPTSIGVQVVVEVPEGTPSVYANYIEVANSPWDFSLILGKLPAKPTSSNIEEMKTSGKMQLTAEITINFPPTLMAGLIRALIAQKELYERMTGTELQPVIN